MAELLEDLPSRGILHPASGSLIGRAPLNYVCDHETEPAADQVVKTEEANVLVSCLEKNRQKDGRKKQQAEKAKEEKRKRPPEGEKSAETAAKKQNTGPSEPYTAQQLRGKSNQELSEILKQKGLPSSGKKDVLVDRILQSRS